MDLEINNLQRLICHKPKQPTNQNPADWCKQFQLKLVLDEHIQQINTNFIHHKAYGPN